MLKLILHCHNSDDYNMCYIPFSTGILMYNKEEKYFLSKKKPNAIRSEIIPDLSKFKEEELFQYSTVAPKIYGLDAQDLKYVQKEMKKKSKKFSADFKIRIGT